MLLNFKFNLFHIVTNFFEQSTRECQWEFYLDRAEVKDTLRQKVLMGQKMGCGSQILDNYIKHRKQK